MSDETTDKPTDPTASEPLTYDFPRLVPLSDIDAFVEIRAGSILDEAALLALQFLGAGDRNAARTIFVTMAMEHFDTIGDAYDVKRWETAARVGRAAMMAAAKKRREEAAVAPAPEETPPRADPEPAK